MLHLVSWVSVALGVVPRPHHVLPVCRDLTRAVRCVHLPLRQLLDQPASCLGPATRRDFRHPLRAELIHRTLPDLLLQQAPSTSVTVAIPAQVR